MKILKSVKNYRDFVAVLFLFGLALVMDLLGKQDSILQLFSTLIIIGVCLVVGSIIIWKMIEKVRYGFLGVDIISVAALGTALALKQYWTAAAILVVVLFSDILQSIAKLKAVTPIGDGSNEHRKIVNVLRGRKTIEVGVSKIHKGDKIVIGAGEVIPVDGIIFDGATDIKLPHLYGMNKSIKRSKGDSLLAGTLNITNTIIIRAHNSVETSQTARIQKIINNSVNNTDSEISRIAEKFSLGFSVLVILFGIAIWVTSSQSERFLQVLVVGSITAFISGPSITLLCGINRAVGQSLIFRKTKALEKISEIRSIIFEKESLEPSKKLNKLLSSLSLRKICSYLLSDESDKVTKSFAQKIGIAECRSGLNFEDRVEFLENMPKRYRPSAFVSTGHEDIVMASADYRIAVESAENINLSNTSFDLLIPIENAFDKIDEAIKISKRTLNMTRITIFIGFILNFLLLGIFATGKIEAIYGVGLKIIADVCVIIVALQAKNRA